MAGSEAKERKILVAIDEGEESTNALSWCLKNIVAENYKDTLILLYCKPPPPLYPAMDGTWNALNARRSKDDNFAPLTLSVWSAKLERQA
ncbi:hypothetical protein Vadar_023652 [Vaccinium darrowii]|uniref:Uncharacterized protein n=1 Tax=Vaccinium darrowii TaxID=229202 RepID=A0ACB7ZM29_9ERIC|nr:hypothetical protein Vadar_023652 [Vaccinium darrowii]